MRCGHGVHLRIRTSKRPAHAFPQGRPFFASTSSALRLLATREGDAYFRWFETSFVISNMETFPLPPNTAFSFSSALMRRLLTASCSLFFLM